MGENERVPILGNENQEQNGHQRRQTDQLLPQLYRFILSLLVIGGGFVYLYIARPDQLVTTAVFGFVGAVITFWFVSRKGGHT